MLLITDEMLHYIIFNTYYSFIILDEQKEEDDDWEFKRDDEQELDYLIDSTYYYDIP